MKKKKIKEGEGKRCGKGKAIIGIAMAAIMLASVFAAMVPTGTAREDNGYIESEDTLFCGENKLLFATDWADTIRLEGRENSAEGEVISIGAGENFYIARDAVEGVYNIINQSGGINGTVTIKKPSITGNVYLAGTVDSIDGKSIPVGQDIKIRASPNFGGFIKQNGTGDPGKIKIKLIDPDEYETVHKKNATGTQMDFDDWSTIDWDTGTWKVKIVTDKASCNELDVSSPEYEFTVRSEELVIEAVEDEVGKREDILLTVRGNPKYYYYFAIENVVNEEEPQIQDTEDVKGTGTGEGKAGNLTAAWIKTGADGVADIKINTTDADERTYTMNVYDTYQVADAVPNETDVFAAPADVIGEKEDDDVDVKVEEAEVTFDIPASTVIGEEVTIKGAISAGDKVDIVIEDANEVFDDVPVDENDEFEEDWDTSGLTKGSYTIVVYIDCEVDTEDPEDYEDIDEDGSISIRLLPGELLNASISKSTVVPGDSFEVYGTTPSDYAEIVAISPRGGNGTGMDGLYGVSVYTVPTFMATAGYSPGSYVIDAFLNGNYSVGEDVSGQESDGFIPIRLISPGLTVNISTNVTVPGGSFVIDGTANGTDHVDIITISPKGGGGAGLYEESYPGVPGITNESIPVENNSFSKTINVSGYATVSSMISGDGGGGGGGRAPPPDSDYTYKIWVSVPGRDGYYGDGYGDNASDILNHIIDYYCTGDVSKLRSKTQDQILDMLKDATINMAGSDDLAGVMDLTVRHPTYNFYKRIKVDSDADTGNYTILVLSPGIDGVYGDSYYSYIDSILDLDGAGPELGAIDVSNMTQEEIISIIEDVTINQAGSDDLIWIGNIVVTQFDIFDTGFGIYPSIMGIHKGEIKPSDNINISKLYTYPCPGTGGHTESIGLYENGELIANGTWNAYVGNWHNITLHNISGASYVMLLEDHKYNYTIITGSYPQIIHARSKDVTGGVINCTEFIDANGKEYNDWIPAIRLE